MVDRVMEEHQRGNVATDLPGGLDELRSRFLFSTVA